MALSAEIGWAFALVVDAAFLALVIAAATREIIAGGNWRNLPVVVLVLVLLAGNVAFHLEAHYEGAADVSIRVGIGVVMLLISLIGGRIIPSFTRNWLVKFNPGRLPVPFGRFDGVVIGLSALALIGWIVAPLSTVTGVVMALVGALHLVRFARWAGDRTTGERLLLILHVGYAFVPLGFLLNALAGFGVLPPSAGIHAWMTGAAGIMTLAVMTRASLGHTGQALTASLATQASTSRSSLRRWRGSLPWYCPRIAICCCTLPPAAGSSRSSASQPRSGRCSPAARGVHSPSSARRPRRDKC